jgi:hypothetical protein
MNWMFLQELRGLLLANPLLVGSCFAAIVLMLQTVGVVRAHRRARVLGAELARLRLQLLGVERLQYEAEEKARQDSVRIDQLERAHRRASAGLGKPDAELARAMIRAGADARALVDCGLSHGESHLARAIHSPP